MGVRQLAGGVAVFVDKAKGLLNVVRDVVRFAGSGGSYNVFVHMGDAPAADTCSPLVRGARMKGRRT